MVLLPITARIGCVCAKNALWYLQQWQWSHCWCRVATPLYTAHVLTQNFLNGVFLTAELKSPHSLFFPGPLSFPPIHNHLPNPLWCTCFPILDILLLAIVRAPSTWLRYLFCECPYWHHNPFQTTIYTKNPDLAVNYKLLWIQSSAEYYHILKSSNFCPF